MRQLMQRMLAGTTAMALLLACGGRQVTVDPLPIGLTGIQWRLVNLGNSSPVVNSAGPDLTLLLSDGRTTSGFSGCNRFSGSYQLNGDTLRFSPLSTTKVGCNGSLRVEQRYLEALGATNRYEVNSDSLVLYQGSTPILIYKR